MKSFDTKFWKRKTFPLQHHDTDLKEMILFKRQEFFGEQSNVRMNVI